MKRLEHHPVSEAFPLMEGDDFKEFVEDIRRNGLLCPIELYEGKIIDGRNRYRACLELGIEPEVVDVDGHVSDPGGYVISLNIHRRHLSISRRAMSMARLRDIYDAKAKERQRQSKGRGQKGKEVCPDLNGQSRDKLGKLAKVSGRTIDKATKILKHGSKELIRAVETDQVTVNRAVTVLDRPKSEQLKALNVKPREPKTRENNGQWKTKTIRRERIERLFNGVDDLVTYLNRGDMFACAYTAWEKATVIHEDVKSMLR